MYPGYPAARQLPSLPNPAPAPTTLDPRAVFARDAAAYACDAADSGDDANVDSSVDSEDGADDDSVNSGPPSSADVDTDSAISISDDDSAISISDDNDSAIDVSDNGSVAMIDDDYADISLADLATFDNNNHNMPALRITTNPATSASAISSSPIVEDGSDSDWGFSSIEDPDFLQAIGRALDDPFGLGTGDGRD